MKKILKRSWVVTRRVLELFIAPLLVGGIVFCFGYFFVGLFNIFMLNGITFESSSTTKEVIASISILFSLFTLIAYIFGIISMWKTIVAHWDAAV